MSYPADILKLAKNIQYELNDYNVVKKEQLSGIDLYDELVINKSLRKCTEKLFRDGHHARAVEEAYKYIDNYVKRKADLVLSDLTGASLMQTVFSPKKPKLKLNEGVNTSEQNEQLGYMHMFAGSMTGIRNPRAHEADWEDTEHRALQLLSFANHLIERVSMAEKVNENL